MYGGGYAPPPFQPPGQQTPPQQAQPQQAAAVAQHLSKAIPGFGNAATLKFRAAARAVTAFAPAPAGYAAPSYAAPSYAAAPPPGNPGGGTEYAPSDYAPLPYAPAYAPQASIPASAVAAPVAAAPVAFARASVVSVGGAASSAAATPATAPPAYTQAQAPRASVTAVPYAAVPSVVAVPDEPTPAPDDFTCPITQELMVDPVICADGHSYERSAIERWLASHDTSPKTNARLEHKQLIPNHSLRGSIEQFQESRRRR